MQYLYVLLKISPVTTDTIHQAGVFCHIMHVMYTMQQLGNGQPWTIHALVRFNLNKTLLKLRLILSQNRFVAVNFLLLLIAIPNYCPTATAPTLSNANTLAPSQVISTNTSFACNNGYQSTGEVTAPYFTCFAMNASMGQWSLVTYSCTSNQEYDTSEVARGNGGNVPPPETPENLQWI